MAILEDGKPLYSISGQISPQAPVTKAMQQPSLGCTLVGMPTWLQLRTIVKAKPPIPTGVILGAVPVLAIASTWMHPLGGFGALSPWLKIAYFASLSFFVAYATFAVRCPETIKRHGTAFERIAEEYEALARSSPSLRIHVVRTQLAHGEPARAELDALEARRDKTIGQERDVITAEIDRLVDREWPNAVQQYLARTHAEDNVKDRAGRLVCFIALLAFGGGVLLVFIHRSYLVSIA